MADRGDTHYFIPRLNRWFLWSSALLFVSLIWMIWDDFNAPWKEYQRRFNEIEVARAQAALESSEAKAALAEKARLEQERARVEAELQAKRDEIAAAEERLRQAMGIQFIRTERAKKLKQEYNWERFLVEEHVVEEGDTQAAARLLDLERALSEAEGAKEAADRAVEEARASLDALRKEEAEIDKQIKAAVHGIELQQKKLENLAPTELSKKIANTIRNDIPGLDFIAPSIRVKKVVLDDLTFELNFTKKTRIDMCMTCHVAIDREGYDQEGLEQPFRSHPRLDLFLTAKSPHPMKDVGCTICHRGAGEALDFVRADHRPSSEEQEAEWKEKHHWHKQHHWDYPMLAADYVEASCVQCHKTSMELIGEAAPKVHDGFRLVERYGCYVCHKIDWYPVKRKPGPSLKRIAQKVTPEFIASWVSNPKAFRPTTWMPQIFYLENVPDNEEIVVSEYGAGVPILGRQWNDTAVAAVTAFLMDRSEKDPLPEIPVEGDAERGREVFRLVGCGACHNLAPYPGEEEDTRDPFFERKGTNEHGPNLRGVASKVTAEWLYAWIRNPADHWPDTRMPNLRLSEQDAADIVAYMTNDPDGIFTDVPEGWSAQAKPYDLTALQEQARWFFARLGRSTIADRLAGKDPAHPWNDPEKLLIEVGEKFVRHQGCYSCHEIEGLENEMPIGTELSTWGSKTVDKLDWGFIPEEFAKKHGWSLEKREEFKQYRENWLAQKLREPRSYDRYRVKNPLEKFRMPQFGFSEHEIEAITTFIVGLVEDEVEHARMEPTPGQLAMDQGARVVREKNCVACHVIEPGRVTFRDEEGTVHDVAAELLPLGDDADPPVQRDLAALQEAIAGYEEAVEELDEIGFRLLEPAPEVGHPSQTVFVPKDAILDIKPPKGGDFVSAVVSYYRGGIEMFDPEAEDPEDAYWYWNLGEEGEVEDVDGELRPYFDEEYPKLRWTFAPPVLIGEGHKLQPEWFYAFLKDPVPLRRQMRVRMPTFHFDEGEAEAVADYFRFKARREWPSLYAKTLRLALGTTPKGGFVPAEGELPWPQLNLMMESGQGISYEALAERTGLSVTALREIEAGYPATIEAGFAKLKDFGDSVGFRMHGPVSDSFEVIERRAPSYFEAHRDTVLIGERLASKDVNCFQCHWHGGAPPDQVDTPIAWAPDLFHAHERLREDWVRDWLWKPDLVYPGTAMPANFAADPPGYQQTYPGSTNAQQIQAVMDWLFNFDRFSALAPN